MRIQKNPGRALAAALAVAVGMGPGSVSVAGDEQDYTDLDLLDLAALSAEVFSASKKTQRLLETPAAVYVVDGDEIRRSGHTTLPEILRLVPGVTVSRITSNRWAIGVRGFNLEFASKLLVLIDGRAVYTPTFSGVYWNLQDMLLDDIDRVEVIRGPGAAIWGSNAVNGVINVITKRAADTPDSRATVTIGDEERLGVGLRVAGGPERLQYRLSTKAFIRDEAVAPDGSSRADEWRAQRASGRLDWQLGPRDSMTLTGGVYHGDSGNAVREYTASGLLTGIPNDQHVNASNNGGHLVASFRREISEGEDVEVQAYYDQLLQRDDLFEDIRHTADVQLQHRRGLGDRTELIWGLGYRRSDYRVGGKESIRLLHSKGADAIYSGFAQTEHRLSDAVRVTLGSKLEWNDISGWEIQPSIRSIWFASPSQQVWAAVSRAVRTPSQGELNADIVSFVVPPGTFGPSSPAVPVQTLGNPDQRSEVLIAYELGYRAQIDERVSIDVSAFWNDYESLREARAIPPLNLSQMLRNGSEGRGVGLEALVDFRALAWWRMTLAYSLFDFRESTDQPSANSRNLTPRHQWRVSSVMQLSKSLELDASYYWVDDAEDLALSPIDKYSRVDLRVAWQPTDAWSLELVGQNLLDRQHLETNSLFSQDVSTEIERSVFVRATLSF